LDPADRRAHQLQHFAADRFDHATHLPVAAFGDGQFKVRISRRSAHPFDDGGTCGPIAQFHAAPKSFEGIVGNKIGALDQIRLRDFVIGVRQPLSELRIVGEDQQAAGIQIEPADRRNESVDIRNQIVDGRASLGILEGRDVTGGLVEQDIERLFGAQWFAVEENPVALEIDPVIRILDNAAVDPDAPRVNPAARLCARANARLRKNPFQRLRA